jgi:hypothetical protein
MAKRNRNNDTPLRDLTPELLDLVRQHDAWWSQWAAETDAADKPTAPVFHYASWDGFHGIMESESFWLHSIFCMNDKTELDYGLGIAHDILTQRNTAACEVGDELAKAFLRPQLSPDRVARIKERFDFYSISFGERDDDRQWDTYGSKRRGISIGLSPALFANVQPHDATPEDNTYIAKVLYGPSTCTERHRAAIDHIFGLLEDARQRSLVETSSAGLALMKVMAASMNVPLIWNSITTKSEGWEHEHESRMLAINDLKNPHLPICRREDGRSYVAIPIPLRKPGIITEIMVGADADSGIEDAVAKLLRSVGMSALPPIGRAKTARRP